MTVITFPAPAGHAFHSPNSSARFIRSIRDAGASIAAACECLKDPAISDESAKAAEELILATASLLAAAETFRDGLPQMKVPATIG